MQNDIALMDLVKYDPTKGCFVLKPQQQQIEYWPGTKIVKSKNNAFSWKNKSSDVVKQLHPNVYKSIKNHNPFTTYSKAQKSK